MLRLASAVVSSVAPRRRLSSGHRGAGAQLLLRRPELRRRPDELARLQQSDASVALLFDERLSPLAVPAPGGGSRRQFEPLLVPWPELQPALQPASSDDQQPVVFLGSDQVRHYFAVAASSELLAWARSRYPAAAPVSGIGLMAATRLTHVWGPARSLLAWRRYHRYCPACGGPTRVEDAGHRLACGNADCLVNAQSGDHPIAHPRLDPTAIVLVTSPDGGCLLARKTAFPPAMLSCLAGFAEPGESLEQCVVREVAEEVGVPVAESRLLYRSSQAWPFPAQLMVGFEARVDGRPEILLDKEELEFADWFTARQVTEMLEQRGQWRVPPRAALANRLITEWLKTAA